MSEKQTIEQIKQELKDRIAEEEGKQAEELKKKKDDAQTEIRNSKLRYKIERYSPGRKDWHYFGEVFPRKKDADLRVKILEVRHLAQDLKFRVIPIGKK